MKGGVGVRKKFPGREYAYRPLHGQYGFPISSHGNVRKYRRTLRSWDIAVLRLLGGSNKKFA